MPDPEKFIFGARNECKIIEGVDLFKSLGTQFVLLNVNFTYPTPIKDFDLNYLLRLKKIQVLFLSEKTLYCTDKFYPVDRGRIFI